MERNPSDARKPPIMAVASPATQDEGQLARANTASVMLWRLGSGFLVG